MVGKNNWEVQLKHGANKVKRYTIKRTSVGVVSAVVAAGLIFGQETSVQADEIIAGESQTTEVSSEEAIETDESIVVEQTTASETSVAESVVEATVASEESTVEEVHTAEELSEPVYEQTEIVDQEEVSEGKILESDDVVADSAVANQEDGSNEAIVETETAVADTKSVQEDTETAEDSATKTEEAASVQPQMSTIAATANVSEADTEFPELISISTDKEVYQAGEDITVTAIVKENDELSGISVSFGRIGEVKTGSSSLFGDAYSEWSGLTRQSDGTYKAEMVIETDEKMPNNTYQLSSVSMYDAAENRVGLNSYNDTTGLFDLSLDIINEDADTEFPELISISTDKEVYQAGEDITVTAIVKENDELSGISVSFGRIGEVKTGSSSLFGDAYSEWSGLTRQSDGTYKAEMVIETDEKMPNNAYQLSSVSMYDAAENRVGLNSYNDTTGLFDLIVSINVANVPYETIRELNIDLTPNSEDVLVQAGVNGSADATTGELINAPVSEIIHYAPVELPFETVEVESDDLYLGESVILPGQVGLLDPETNEVVVAPVNEIIQIGSKLAPEELPFETERVLDINLAPGSSDQLVQEGQVGLRDSETGEVISNPIKRIYSYAPTIVDYEIIRMFNPNQEPDSIDIVVKHGEIGLMDPETNEVVIKPIAEVISFAPVTMAYDVEYQIDDSLEPDSGDTVELQPGSEGLQNPDTGEVLVAPVNRIIGQAPYEYIDDTTVQNIITIVDQITNQEIASTTFLGNNYSIRQNYFINQLNNKHNLALEVVGEDRISKTISTATGNGYTVTSTKIKKNVYVLNNNNTDISSIKKPFLPEGIIYNNLDYERIYRKVSIQDNYGSILYSASYVAYESTDDTIRGAMSNINSSDYYYDSVEVNEGFTTVFGSMGYYRGPLKKITILVNQVEDIEVPETPVEPEIPEVEEPETPEVPEVEEPETPVEPEVPEVEEPETPVEPEVPEVEEPETPVEPEVPEVEEPETPVEPEIPEVEEPETPVEPEVPEVEEPETPVEPEVPEVEEPETPVEPEVPEVEEPETPVEPEIPAVEESETPTNPEVPVVEEPETPAEPETPVAEDPETVVESEVPTNDVKAPVATSEDGVVVAEPIPTPAQTVATEGAKAESEVVVAETGSKVAETVLSAEVKAEETSTTVDDQVATLPVAGAQTMSVLATGLGVITTALGAVLVRKKK
ncbi:YSIRK-type signal peptide-containing protein [Aerococcus urinaeequi]|uniref:YSIRK-type signal peptide-containing protein n=1 Tax=Aerococcus urinaeequi TaxID=51665 RepID=UPI003EC55F86